MIKSLLKEPLIHFMLLGILVFTLYQSVGDTGSAFQEANTINVDRQALLRYMQHQAKSFDAERFDTLLDSATVEQRQRLLQDYITEEALYREAKALGLDQNDSIAKRRLVQQLSGIFQGLEALAIEIDKAELETHYQQNLASYYEPARLTFTHVFVSTRDKDKVSAASEAQQLLAILNTEKVAFHQALAYGDRFLYHRNYVKREADLVASHFGEVMQQSLLTLPAHKQQWQGPFESPYGYHLVMLTQQIAGFTPPLEAIGDRVRQDALRAKQALALEETKAAVVKQYKVVIAEDLDAGGDA